ncbi:hypothetical protein ACFXGA_37335, partial [Actinosynnema sp. NPDC059335]
MSTGPIVVGIDGTPAAERALRWAMVEATRHDVPLERRARDATMSVVASHGGGRVRRAVLGSTSSQWVRHATVGGGGGAPPPPARAPAPPPARGRARGGRAL